MKMYTKGTIDFYNKHAEYYIKSGTVVFKNLINKFIGLLKGSNVLDVGCGPGHDTDYFTSKGFNCLGIDLSKRMIAYARKNYRGKFRVLDFFNPRFKENTFDGVWCSAAIIHVDKKDLRKLMKNFFRILKNDGLLGVIVPRYYKRHKEKNDTRIFNMFYKNELEKILVQNGFKITHSEIFDFAKKKWIFVISKKKGHA